jgi:hypothetical protein
MPGGTGETDGELAFPQVPDGAGRRQGGEPEGRRLAPARQSRAPNIADALNEFWSFKDVEKPPWTAKYYREKLKPFNEHFGPRP